MKCAKCQFENPEGLIFCGQCGAKLERTCPNCNLPNPLDFKFCGGCGQKLILPSRPTPKELSYEEKLAKIQRYLPNGLINKILSQKGKIEGERKHITIMFCDMMGFTQLTEKLGPEETFSLMDHIYEILFHKVNEYHGTINELRGDGILALFGAPIALEDAPHRAIQSALAIHQEMIQFSENLGDKSNVHPILFRIGINTGPVVVGTVGNDLRVQFIAVGDTINMASRMETLAEPGTTYVTEETYRLTKDLFHFQPLGKKRVKGKEEPLPVYKVLSAKEAVYRPRLGSERRIYSGMVGRDSELNRLETQVINAINGQGSVINIIGEAGIGKSRLIAELKRREVMKRVTLLEGTAISIGKNLSFHPIIDLSKQWVGIRSDDDESNAFNKLEAAIKRLLPEEYGEVLPFVATLMRMKLPESHAQRTKGIEGEALKRLILKSLRDLLVKVSELNPLVIVIEDLHWADTSSVELMEPLFRLAETHKILFINLFRPGYKETGDRLAESLKDRNVNYYVEMVLEPLAEKTSEALISGMLNISKLQHGIATSIIERTGGNPFFIEEVVRCLIDEQALLPKEGRFQLTDKAATISIPNTIEALLTARIDRLEEQTRDLVKQASIIGRSFFYRILTEVTSEIEDIDGRLSYLQEIQLLRERMRMGELEYLFNHALVQEVAYTSILPPKRKELHLNVARSIEKIFCERLNEFQGMLAYHYSRAEDLEKAEECLIKAGGEALKSSASNEALYYYQEALSIYRRLQGDRVDPEKVAMLEKNIGLALFNKGQYADALKYLDRVLERWGLMSPKNRLNMTFRLVSDLLNLIINLYLPSGRLKRIPNERENEIFTVLEKKLIVLAFLEPRRFFVEFLMALRWSSKLDITKIQNGVSRYSGASALFSWTGISFRLSKKILDHVKGLINKDDSKEVLNYRLFQLYHDFFTGHWSGYEEVDESLLELNLKVGQTWQVSTFIFFLCSIKIDQGYTREAKELISRLSEIWEAYENENTLGYIHSLKIRMLLKLRKLRDAQVEVDEALSFATRTRRDLSILSYTGLKAIMQILLKDIGGARESLAQAKDLLSQESKRIPYFIVNHLLGQFLFDLYQLENAILLDDRSRISEYGKKAFKNGKLALKNSRKLACDRTVVFRLMGLYCWLMNSQNKAIGWWRRSMAEGEHLGDRVELARTHMEIGKRLLEKKSRLRELDGVESEAYLEKARIPFEQMGLDWDLDELDKIKASRKLSPL